MLFEGTRDFRAPFATYGFLGYEKVLKKAKEKEVKRYLPIYENVNQKIFSWLKLIKYWLLGS